MTIRHPLLLAGQFASGTRATTPTGQEAKPGLSLPNAAFLGRGRVKTQSQSAATSLVRLHVGSSCGQDGGTDFGRSWRAGGAAALSRGSGRRGLAVGAGRGEFRAGLGGRSSRCPRNSSVAYLGPRAAVRRRKPCREEGRVGGKVEESRRGP